MPSPSPAARAAIATRGAIATVLLGLAAGLAGWLAGLTTPLETLEGRALDWRFQFRGPRGERSDRVALVLVEEQARLPYRSPIPRDHLARIVERLGEAELIGLDILLDQASFDAEGDERLRRAIGRAGNVVAVSYLSDGVEHLPDPSFGAALLDHGYATFSTSSDVEVVRRGTVWQRVDGTIALSLAGCLYAHSRDMDTAALRAGGAQRLPRDLLISFSGPPNAVYRSAPDEMPGGLTVCPSHLVAAGVYPTRFFRDRIVLIGSGLMDAPDVFRTPFFAGSSGYEKTYGVEIHGQFLRTLLEGDQLLELGRGWRAGLILLLALVGAGLVAATDSIRGAALSAALLAVLWTVGFGAFSWWGTVLPLITPSLSLCLACGAAIARYGLTEGREKRQVRRMFERYLAPDVVQQLLADPASWELGGRSMSVTVMFADLEGFTPVSERLAPQELVSLVNEFLTEMSGIIWMQGGTIDKYEGDLIMAFFGAPLQQLDHAARACRAALRMQARMAELRALWRERGLPELRVRIGLHSGTAVVGNMGSEYHFDYTAMGDTVNLASRLEGANKEFGTYLIVSAETRRQAGSDEFAYRDRGTVMVKGKSAPIQVYELIEPSVAGPSGSSGGAGGAGPPASRR